MKSIYIISILCMLSTCKGYLYGQKDLIKKCQDVVSLREREVIFEAKGGSQNLTILRPGTSCINANITVYNALPEWIEINIVRSTSMEIVCKSNSSIVKRNFTVQFSVNGKLAQATLSVVQEQKILAEFYPVNDGDGYGDMYATPHLETLPNPDWVENNEDYDDSNEAINPETIGCTDQDRNGLGDPNDTKKGCFRPNSYILNNDDKCPFASGPLDNNGCPVDYENISYSDENYLFTRTYQKAMTTADGIEDSRDVQESIVYYDGLGRPKQGVAIRQSPRMQDIVTHIGYDAFGRQDKEYLPFVPDPVPDSYGSFRSGDVAGSTQAYYQSKYPADFTGLTVSQVNAYAQKQLEASSAAMVTTYTYDPLIGVTSITDPRGVTTRYSYDDFNRLEFIRDETNSLLEQYRYHYKD